MNTYMGWKNRATWHAARWLTSGVSDYYDALDAAQMGGSVRAGAENLRTLARDLAMPYPSGTSETEVDWTEIAENLRSES